MKENVALYIVQLKAADPTDDKLFKEILIQAAVLVGVTNIPHEFGISRITLVRWLEGLSAPHPALRPHVYKYITGQVEKLFATMD